MVTKHQADLAVLCGCFPLAILHLVVYISPCHSLTSSQLTLPPPHVLKSILYVCNFIPVLPLGSSEPFFRFHIYVLAYSICFSLSDLLHSVWQTLGPSTSLQITQFRFFLWLSNIPLTTMFLCVCTRGEKYSVRHNVWILLTVIEMSAHRYVCEGEGHLSVHLSVHVSWV